MTPVITFLSDFGLTDSYVGICRAVIAGIAPGATVVDLVHTVPARDVRRGAVLLADCVSVAPAGIHLAVVDPDADARPGVVVEAGGALLVGPDNGLLLPAADVLGGAVAAHQLRDPRWHRTPVSPVFRGRDVFGPVAAHLANGLAPDAAGPALPVDDLQRRRGLDADVGHRRIAAPIRNIDCYGNVQLTVTQADLRRAGLDSGQPVRVGTPGETVELARVASFSDLGSGELGIVEDSFGWLAIVAGGADAADRLDLRAVDAVRLGDG
ncbi:MAG TPA: SAM-dependent chlorinase/fluorinase [Euzebyales bacterium]|nr:SAM-dependent chlorinase/fluorinase [Euzebyales bacterium]